MYNFERISRVEGIQDEMKKEQAKVEKISAKIDEAVEQQKSILACDAVTVYLLGITAGMQYSDDNNIRVLGSYISDVVENKMSPFQLCAELSAMLRMIFHSVVEEPQENAFDVREDTEKETEFDKLVESLNQLYDTMMILLRSECTSLPIIKDLADIIMYCLSMY